jgi:hypothetical protein
MTAFALGFSIFEQTGSTGSFAVVMLSHFLSAILFNPIDGLLADRFDRRLMIILGDAGSVYRVTICKGRGNAFVLVFCGVGVFCVAIMKKKEKKSMFRSSYEIEKMATIRCEEIRREMGKLDQIKKIKKYQKTKQRSIFEIVSCLLTPLVITAKTQIRRKR